jgi:hypothetical protein
MVLDANTIVKPYAMMVIPLHALVTCGTVERPWGLYDEALRA